MKYLLFLFSLFSFISFSQEFTDLNPEERAYLYHVVKKSPILDNNMGRFFTYTGPDIRLKNGQIHYDSIEELMINQPDLLTIRKSEIAKSPKGLLAEAANKMAIWQLNKALLAYRAEDGSNTQVELFNEFQNTLLGHLPLSATKKKDDSVFVHPKIYNVLNPSLALNEKIAMLEGFRFLNFSERKDVLDAISYSTNHFVEKRARQIFLELGGEVDIFTNILIAAGDGSNTSGLLEEREKDEKGRWNRGLPKAVGLFPYQLSIVETENKNKRITKRIEPARIALYDFETVGNNRLTNLHFDVWGYNAKKQTTVVLEKNGKSYRLFGSGETRFLSPDSAFGSGGTYQSIIDEMEKEKIGDLNNLIYGKKGFDHWIDYNNKKKDETELRIEKSEKMYSDFGLTAISTSKKASRRTKKAKRKSTTLRDYQPTTNSQKRARVEKQNEIVALYDRFNAYKRKIKELEDQKEEAMDLIAKYQIRLDSYKRAFGYYPMSYTEKDGLYLFEDSTTFDLYTQEFTFPASLDTVPFEVKLLAIPNSALSKNADEVMLHINLMDAKPNYNARIQLALNDVFSSDSFVLNQPLFTDDDSLSIHMFLEGLLDKNVDFNINAFGDGIGVKKGVNIVKNLNAVEEKTYPGANTEEQNKARDGQDYKELRRSELTVNLNRSIDLEVHSYTDPVASNLKVIDEEIENQTRKTNASKNDVLSAMRTIEILKKLKSEINVYAGHYLTRSEAKIVIDRFNKELSKTKVLVANEYIKISL